jgi:hypothetical protein
MRSNRSAPSSGSGSLSSEGSTRHAVLNVWRISSRAASSFIGFTSVRGVCDLLVSGMSTGSDYIALRRALELRSHVTVLNDRRLQTWLDCEIGGYGVLADVVSLHELLGVTPNDPLVQQITSYRTQYGTVFEEPERLSDPPRLIAHFFVEPISELEHLAEHARKAQWAGPLLSIDFGPHASVHDYPKKAAFPVGVFDRILNGFLRAVDAVAGRA